MKSPSEGQKPGRSGAGDSSPAPHSTVSPARAADGMPVSSLALAAEVPQSEHSRRVGAVDRSAAMGESLEVTIGPAGNPQAKARRRGRAKGFTRNPDRPI